MTKNYQGEQWKPVIFDFEFTNDNRIEISSKGRVRSFNKVSNGNIINGSLIEGYRIIRLKLFKPREEKVQTQLDYLQQQVTILTKKIKVLKTEPENIDKIAILEELLKNLKQNLSKKRAADTKKRTINYHSLIHRLVANYFLNKPTSDQTIVAHINHDKLNNNAENLKWMTPEENYKHQQNSPHVIKEKIERKLKPTDHSKATKLSVTKVMLMKKLLNQGKPMRQLVRQFKVTETQIYRIKRGENWSDVPMAN